MRTPVDYDNKLTTEGVVRDPVVDFGEDQFALRRDNSGYGNPYDPNSLLTGAEETEGFTYTNSTRVWPSRAVLRLAIEGKLSTEAILAIAPRQFKDAVQSGSPAIVGDVLANVSEGEVREAYETN